MGAHCPRGWVVSSEMKMGGKDIQTDKHEQRHRDETQHSEHGKLYIVYLGHKNQQDGVGIENKAWDGGRGHTAVTPHCPCHTTGLLQPLPGPKLEMALPPQHCAHNRCRHFQPWAPPPCYCGPGISCFYKLTPQGEPTGPAGLGCLERGWWDTEVVSCPIRGWDLFSPSLVFGLGRDSPRGGRDVTYSTHQWSISHSSSWSLIRLLKE